NAQRAHMRCCDPRPLGRSLICRGVLFFARGWRGAVWGGFQPVADITTGITERALLDLKARCPKKWPRTPGQRRLAPPFSEGDRPCPCQTREPRPSGALDVGYALSLTLERLMAGALARPLGLVHLDEDDLCPATL